MKLHNERSEFENYITATANHKGISNNAIKRDYYILRLLEKISLSEYKDNCVFKGGTSLSKCYPDTIKRFSEDIDLTFITSEDLSDKQFGKELKRIEEIVAKNEILEIIPEERNNRNKSSWIYFPNEPKNIRVKFEIGSSVRPDPYEKRRFKSYIYEYLIAIDRKDLANKYELKEIELNVLDPRRTFIDKIMAVKRHALANNLVAKVRHIYDVTMLYKTDDIQTFLSDKEELKRIVKLTKDSDSYYFKKRPIEGTFNSLEPYAFDLWSDSFSDNVKNAYENLHKTLLFEDEKQDFNFAKETFGKINDILKEIDE